MNVNASAAALEFVRERGGKLYVWSRSSRCCGGRLRFLAAATRDDGKHHFRRVPAQELELYVDLPTLPAELELDVRGLLRRNIRAYWDGCAWIS
ncbi:MAG TPA: hypothetical protein VF002_03905 [Gaiellaceae bacterium]